MAAAHSSWGARRFRLLATLALLAAFTLLVGAHRAAASAANPATTTTLTASSTSVTAGDTVTLTATVTGNGGAPTGIVDFFNNTSSGRVQLDTVDGPVWLVPTGPNTSQATWQWKPAFGSYDVTAVYTSTDSTDFQNSTSNDVQVSSASAAPHDTKIDFTVDPTTIVAGGTVNLKAVVSETDGPLVPTGTVTFSSSPTPGPSTQTTIKQVTLVNGVATLDDVGGWASAGDYTLDATYSGDTLDNPIGSSLTLHVDPGVDPDVHTTTTVTPTPSEITAGGSVKLVAHVTQVGNPTAPPGNNVDFRSTSVYGSQVELGQAPLDANGYATLTVTFPNAADYTISASYFGDITTHVLGSSGITSVTVDGPRLTTTTYTGATKVDRGGTATLSALLIDTATQAPVTGELMTLTVGLESCSAKTDASGVASCGVVVEDAGGSYTVHASFAGDANHLASSGTGTLTVVVPDTTSLTYTGTTDALGGAPVTLSFVLRDTVLNAVVAGQTVEIAFDGKTYSAVTDANGVASVPATAPPTDDGYTVGGSFTDSSGTYVGSTASGTLNVHTLTTSLTYVGDTTANGGGPASIAFLLQDSKGNTLAGQTVSLAIGGATYTATTDGSGIASVPILAPGVADTYTVDGTFAGAPGYASTTGSGSLKVTMVPTTTTYNGDTQTVVGATVTLAATLVDKTTGAPLSGETLTFQFGAETCSGSTDATGHASCAAVVTDLPDSYTVTASFAGEAGHIGSSGTGTIVVSRAPTVTTDNVSGTFLLGSTLTLSGTLKANGAPLAGKTLSFTFGATGCSGTTGADGTATCQVTVPGPTGPVSPVAASFAGDVSYKPSSGSSTALVYGLAPGGGTFVVGDKTASGNVYFWGSQWWKSNVLSAGDAQAVDPGAFKGFAAAPAVPQCGGTWTTAPGNSTPPPSGPLPAYMAVVVTSRNHKSGSTLSGNIVHVVVVKTNAGYDGNPGHDGTGTVVAPVC